MSDKKLNNLQGNIFDMIDHACEKIKESESWFWSIIWTGYLLAYEEIRETVNYYINKKDE